MMSGRKVKLVNQAGTGLPIEPPCRLVLPRPRRFTTQESRGRGTAQVNLRPPADRSRRDDPERSSEASMGVSTDPDTNMDMQQAHVRNMRSKCRCSCVLQFTLRHGVSSVLHRPPSQMIHCMVLYLVSGLAAGQFFIGKNRFPHAHQGGAQNPSRRRGSSKLDYRLSLKATTAHSTSDRAVGRHDRPGSRKHQSRLYGQRQTGRDPEAAKQPEVLSKFSLPKLRY